MNNCDLAELELRLQRELGVDQNWWGRYVAPSSARTAAMVALHKKGATMDAIGAKFGLSGASARHWLKKAGVLHPAPVRPREASRRVRLEQQMAALHDERRRNVVTYSTAKFAHASHDVWTPERMWHQLQTERTVEGARDE